jgi:hypothetical protein
MSNKNKKLLYTDKVCFLQLYKYVRHISKVVWHVKLLVKILFKFTFIIIYSISNISLTILRMVLLHNGGFCNNYTPKQCLHISVHFQTNTL